MPPEDVLSAPQLVHELLEHAAARWPEKEALVVAESLLPAPGAAGTASAAPLKPNPRWSYRQLNERANRLARWLGQRGLQPGDRVALLAANGEFYVVAYFAILKAGGIAVPLSTAIDVTTLLHQLAICKPRMLLVGSRSERVVVDAGERLEARAAQVETTLSGYAAAEDLQALRAEVEQIKARPSALRAAAPAQPRSPSRPTAKPEPPPLPFRIVGAELRAGQRSLSVTPNNGNFTPDRLHVLLPGDALGPWRLQAVEGNTAVFQAGDQTRRVAIP